MPEGVEYAHILHLIYSGKEVGMPPVSMSNEEMQAKLETILKYVSENEKNLKIKRWTGYSFNKGNTIIELSISGKALKITIGENYIDIGARNEILTALIAQIASFVMRRYVEQEKQRRNSFLKSFDSDFPG